MSTKKLVLSALTSVAILSVSNISLASSVDLIIDNKQLDPEVPPKITDGRTMVPIRVISENLGAYVDWDSNTQSVIIKNQDHNYDNPVTDPGENVNLIVNGKLQDTTVPPIISESRTLVPIRAASEALGAYIDWDGDTQTVTVYSDSSSDKSEDNKNKTQNSSKKWDESKYEEYDSTNFRDCDLFHETVDFNEIDYPRLNAAIFFITNEIRTEHGLKELEYSHRLEIAAWNHSKSMVEYDFFSHNNEHDDQRYTPSDRGELAGIDNPQIAENIAMRSFEEESYLSMAESALNMWMNSTGHRENILSEQGVQLGTGAYQGNDSADFRGTAIYFTQKFQWFHEIEKSDEVHDADPYNLP